MDPTRRKFVFTLTGLMAGAAVLSAIPLHHSLSDDKIGGEHDHERARRALERGEIRPLSEILASVRARIPGEVVKVEIEREDGVWVYELKIVAKDGRFLEVYVDAKTARIIKIEGE